MLARGDAAEHVGDHQHHRQQQVGPDDRQLGDRDAGQGGGDEPHHEAERADHQLRGRAAVGGPVDGAHAVAQQPAEQAAEEQPTSAPADDGPAAQAP